MLRLDTHSWKRLHMYFMGSPSNWKPLMYGPTKNRRK